MRIAVLIAGAPRTILNCAPSIISFLDPKHQIDYFLHIWDDNLTDPTKDQIKHWFNPIECNFVPFMTWDASRDSISHLCNKSYDVRTIYSKSWANYAVNNMRLRYERTHKFTYDAVAFLRPDIIYGISQFDPEPYLDDPKKVIQSSRQNFGMWSDQFIICRDEAATHFASLILWMMAHMPMLESHTYPVCGECNVKTWMTMYGNYTRHILDLPHKIVRIMDIGKEFNRVTETAPQDIKIWK